MDLNAFLVAKRLGAPTWVWIAGGVGVLSFVVLKMKGGSKAASTDGTGGSTSAGTGSPGFLSSDATMPLTQQGGDTYINGVPSQSQPTVPSALAMMPTSTYVVTGATNPSDRYPGGVAIAAYKLSASDAVDIAFYAIDIQLLNPGVTPPYQVGAQLKIPTNPNKTTSTSPYPQTTSTTTS